MSQRDSVHEILVHNPLFHDTVEYADVNRFSSDMYDLVNNDLLSDIVFEVGPEKTKIYGHKVILCQRSVYFKQMFVTSHMREMNSNTVVKPNVDVETFLKVLRFLYSGRVHLSRSTTADALHVLAAADEMQILDLKRMCVEHVKQYIDVDCAIQLLDLANKYNSEELLQCCFEFIKHNTREVLASELFVTISKDTLFQFLDSEFLAVDEIEVYRAMLRWGLVKVQEMYRQEEEQQRQKQRHSADLKLELNQEQIELLRKRDSVPVQPQLSDVQSDEVTIDELTEDEEDYQIIKQSPTNYKRKMSNLFALVTRQEIDTDPDQTKHMNMISEFISPNYKSKRMSLCDDIASVAEILTEEDKLRLRRVLRDLIPLIRYPLMNSHQLTDMVEPFQLLPDWLLLEAYRHMSAPDRSIGSKRAQKRKGFSESKTGMFDNSTILSEKHKQTLLQWQALPTKKKWIMQYKGTRDGFMARIFHELCDNKGPTIVVCRTTEGYIFGGYNSQHWTSKNCWQAASDTFIFSLVNPYNDGTRKMKVKNPQRALYNHESFGPTFGGGVVSDVTIVNNIVMRGHTNVGNAYSTFRGGFRSDEAQKSLAGSLNTWVLNEVEVFVLA